jgi:hypothetical protein
VVLAGGGAPDGYDDLDARIEQAFAQNALSDHSAGAEENDSHSPIRT